MRRSRNRKIVSRAAWLILLIIVLFVGLVDKERLPESWQKNEIVNNLYAQRNHYMNSTSPGEKPVTTEKTTDKTGAGYSDTDRTKLDKLISTGAQDH